MEQYDDLVLGGGNAVALAITLGKAGRRVALVEEGPLGGTCPNRGCIPSKLLLAYAHVAETIRDAGRFHIDAELKSIDARAILREVKRAQAPTDSALEGALPETVTLVRGRGKFVEGGALQAAGRTLRGARVIVATGSRPAVPAIPGLHGTPFWTSRDVFRIEEAPASLIVIGGGYIGCELGLFFAGIGVDVTVLQRSAELLPALDDEVRAVFNAGFQSHVRTLVSVEATRVAHRTGLFEVGIREVGGSQRTLGAEALLVCTGRHPNTHGIGLEHLGVELDERGYLPVDDHLRSGAENVWALGDVTGGPQFTHAAAWQATYLGNQLLGKDDGPLEYGPMPWTVFSSPEVAGVGKTEQELRAAGEKFVAAAVPYSNAAKGRALKERHGLVKLLAAPDGTLLGAHIVGAHASLLLHEILPVMRWRNNVSSLTGMVHVHPALPELVRNVARKLAKKLAG